jgi:hypothetical protein
MTTGVTGRPGVTFPKIYIDGQDTGKFATGVKQDYYGKTLEVKIS